MVEGEREDFTHRMMSNLDGEKDKKIAELVKALRLAQGYISYDTDHPKADDLLAKIGAALDLVG